MDESETEQLLRRIGERAQALGLGVLNEEQRNVIIPWWARGELGNGGFEQFFQTDHPLADVSRRLRLLGFEAAADACDQVLAALFSGGREPVDRAAKEALLAEVDWKRFRPQERVIFAIDWDELVRAIGRYVDAYPGAFGILRS
jgi:Domain of unknown function (DUF4375)